MRRAITFLLLAATAAGPLAAQAWSGQRANRDGAGDAPGAPRDRGERAGDPDRPEAARDRPGGRGDWRAASGDPRPHGREDRRADAPAPGEAPAWRASPGVPRAPADRRREEAFRNGADLGERRDWRGPPGAFRRNGPDRDADKEGDPRWSENRRAGWDARWREDRRYDWQGHRAGNRAIYRAPRYYDPRGGGYDRWLRGRRVQPAFYDRSYWIADPWRYRLPPARGDYRWVRYHDDVALIDTRTGRIEDIVHGLFWR